MPQIEEIINDSEDEMPQLDGAETSQANDAHSVRASHIQDSHVIDSDDESDGMPELVEAPNEGSSRKTAVVDSEDDDGEDDEDDDDDMPDLVDIQPEAYGRGATTIDEDSDDDMPELVDLGPTGQHSGNYSEYDNESSTLASSTRKLRYGDTTSLYDEASTCCNMAFLHILGVCSSSLVFKLKALINERKMVTTENIRANKSMVDAEARLMDLRYSMTAEKQKEEEDLIDQTWEEIGLLETKLLAINASLKATDLEFLTEIKRAHHRLQSLYGRRKAGKSFGKGSKASAERLQSERRYQEDNGRKGVMSEEAAANILGLAEIDKALKTLSNPKFRQNYLVLANDSQFKSKRRTPKYADMSEAEVQELRMPKKQEPVSSLMKRQRTGGLQRYNNNPNRIQRVILLEYPTQPTCPDVSITDTAEGRFVHVSWVVSLSEERAVNRCEVSMRANGGLWNPVWAGDVNDCVLTIEEYGLLSFRIRARNELGWGVPSYIRDVNVLKWKAPVKVSHVHSKKSSASISSKVAEGAAADVEAAVTSLKEKISTITAANPDLNSRLRVLTELIGALPATTRHHSHLPALTKHVATVIQTTEHALQKQAKQITNQWRIKLNALTNDILRTPDVSFTNPKSTGWTTRSEFSDLLENYGSSSNTEELELTSQSKNQIWQAISGLYMKRPTKLIPMVVINSKQQQQVSEDGTPVIVTPGLAILRKIDRLLQTYVEASESGVFTVSQTGVKEWSETVSRQVNRSIEREEVKSDEVLKMERQRIERERVEAAERERKEQARIDAELKRQAAAEEKERVLIAKREAKEEQERREALMKEEAAKAKAVEAEREKLRQKGLEESRVMRDELMRKQTPGYEQIESHNNQHTQPAAKASAIRVVRVPRNKPSTSSLQSNNNVDVEADAPVSVKRLDYGVNRVPKFGSHGEESRVEVKSQPMCKFFNTSNGCRNGTNCKNLHVNSGAVAAESDNSVGGGDVEVCKYFNTKAGCRFGDKCRHAHIEGQQRPFRAHKQSKIKEGEDAVVV